MGVRGTTLPQSKTLMMDFPGGTVEGIPTANTGDTGWSRKISHVVEQLSPCTTTTEPTL